MPAHRARMRMGSFLRDARRSHEFGIKMLVCRSQRTDDLVRIIASDDRDRFAFPLRSVESVMRDRPDRFAYRRRFGLGLDRSYRLAYRRHYFRRLLLLNNLRGRLAFTSGIRFVTSGGISFVVTAGFSSATVCFSFATACGSLVTTCGSFVATWRFLSPAAARRLLQNHFRCFLGYDLNGILLRRWWLAGGYRKPVWCERLGGAIVVKIIKSAAVAALTRTLLGTDCRMPRNTVFGKRFFRLLKELAEEKLFCSKTIRATSESWRKRRNRRKAAHVKIIAGFSPAGLSHSSAH